MRFFRGKDNPPKDKVWFAWYPVLLDSGEMAWLEKVRIRYYWHSIWKEWRKDYLKL